jgi:hypothetical protein
VPRPPVAGLVHARIQAEIGDQLVGLRVPGERDQRIRWNVITDSRRT